MTTGVGLARARSSRHTSKPFLRGSVTLRITRSGAVENALARPSSPSDAVTTSYPSSSRLSRRPSNICGSSSITRIRFVNVDVSSVEREVERKGTATSRLAVNPHEAAVGPHHVVDDGEPEAAALRSRPGIGLHAIELLENLALQARRDANAVVAHAHDAVAARRVDLDDDLAVLGRVLHRVRQQVLERLLRRLRVQLDRNRRLRRAERDRELIVPELAVERIDDAAGDGREIRRLELILPQSPLDLREVEQVVDQPRQLAPLAVDDSVVLGRPPRVLQPSELQRFRAELNERERRLEIVRDARHEVRLHLG